MEKCDAFQGFQVFCGVGGSTGVGFLSYLYELLDDYNPPAIHAYALYPSTKNSTDLYEPLNAVVSTQYLREITSTVCVLENDAIANICKSQNNVKRPS